MNSKKRKTGKRPKKEKIVWSRSVESNGGQSESLDSLNQQLHAANQQLHAQQQSLLEGESRFRNVIENSPVGMHMYRLESGNRLVFIGANPAADAILKLDNSQFIGKTLEDAFYPSYKNIFLETCKMLEIKPDKRLIKDPIIDNFKGPY